MAAAGTIVETASVGSAQRRPGDPLRYSILWTSDGSGNVTQTLGTTITGVLAKVQLVPSGGTLAPSDAYTLSVTDSAGINQILGNGTTFSGSAASQWCPGVKISDGATTTSTVANSLTGDTLSLNVSGAGAANCGTVILHLA